MAEILQDIWNKPMADNKLRNKLEKYKVPQNCNFLKTKRCNPEIWSIKLSEQQRSNDLKIQKIQNTLLKSATAMTTLTEKLLSLHNNKDFSSKDFRKEMGTIIPNATDVMGLLAHSMRLGNNLRRQKIACSLETELRGLGKDVDEKSELLFGDDLSKRIGEVKTNHKALQSSSKPHSKNFSRSLKYPRDLYKGYQSQGLGRKFQRYNSSFKPGYNNKYSQGKTKKEGKKF